MKLLTTWSRLTFTPFAGHQYLNDLDMSIQAGFTAVGEKKESYNSDILKTQMTNLFCAALNLIVIQTWLL